MYDKTVLDNGIRIVSEEVNQVRSVSFGVFVGCGARHEPESAGGVSHFLEHMFFKGTARRTAYDIAAEIDSIGGFINAFTGKENTTYYLKVPDYHFPGAVDLLADMLINSLFDPEEIGKERDVIIQEINLLEDSPDDCIHDYFEASLWPGQAVGRAILGTRETVARMSREQLLSCRRGGYGAENIVISASGNVKHEALVDRVREAFAGLAVKAPPTINAVPVPQAGLHVMERDLEQVHLVTGAIAPSALSPRRHVALIANAILGGCMSSRLFQEIREKRGLAYAVNSFYSSYLDTGIFGIYVGAGAEKIPAVTRLIETELERLRQEPVSDREISSAKELIKGGFLMSLESTDSRMMRLARNEVFFGRHISPDEFVAGVENVTAEDILLLAREVFAPDKLAMVAMGNIRREDLTS